VALTRIHLSSFYSYDPISPVSGEYLLAGISDGDEKILKNATIFFGCHEGRLLVADTLDSEELLGRSTAL